MKRFNYIVDHFIPGIHFLRSGNMCIGVLYLSGFIFSVVTFLIISAKRTLFQPPVAQAIPDPKDGIPIGTGTSSEQLIAVIFVFMLFMTVLILNYYSVRKEQRLQSVTKVESSSYSLVLSKLNKDNFAIGALSIIFILLCIAFTGPLISPHHPDVQNDLVLSRYQTPSFQHFFGTDKFGRDVFSRVLYGTRISLTIGIFTVVLSILTGTIIGAFAGYFGGVIDGFLMRIADIFFAFPRLLLILLIVSLFSPSILIIVLVLSSTGWMTVSRLIRAEVLSIKNQEYVTAAHALGLSRIRVLFRHILPNALTPALVALSLRIGNVILAESTLSFLGLGVQPPTASWGNMIYGGRENLLDAWWISTFPGLAILVTVICFNILADSIRDAMDPKVQFKI